MNAVFSPGFFEGIVGQKKGRGKKMQFEGKRKGRSDRKKHLLGIEPMPGLKV